ncbi:hypothetical protein [Roseimaritima sediminicola]|uniref:hypothetical protein n=1 Tax=Roseimaritima sediminicola TaxID=2662066 RepID=UPI001298361C|nr:hypothetical protein [Roseimaritima sediminicola]
MVWVACRIVGRTPVLAVLLMVVACSAPTDAYASVDASDSGDTAVAEERVAQVPPVGWRRTVRGWERLDSDPGWAINQWIQHQQAEESTSRLLRLVRPLGRLHPVALAAGLLCVACLLAALSRSPEPARLDP